MSQKIIGITCSNSPDPHETWDFCKIYVPSSYIEGINQTEALPFLIPIQEDLTLAESYVQKVDALLFTGGQDVHPMFYGQDPLPELQGFSQIRDLWEQTLLQVAIDQHKPILAICRGFQAINVFLGGTLYQDLSYFEHSNRPKVQHVQDNYQIIYPHHSLTIQKPSVLYDLLGQETSRVNSCHHQGIKDLAPGLKAIAWSSDGLIEAFQSSKEYPPILGVQWHPEMMIQHNDEMLPLFQWLADV